MKETPPRAWGRLSAVSFCFTSGRNTPTCVGKTVTRPSDFRGRWKHPHVRGEDPCPRQSCRCTRETPPRAWGRPLQIWSASKMRRNTPTCVGKTVLSNFSFSILGKHPHVRGEDYRLLNVRHFGVETPPRAWGRLKRLEVQVSVLGNTPTCVGKTFF